MAANQYSFKQYSIAHCCVFALLKCGRQYRTAKPPFGQFHNPKYQKTILLLLSPAALYVSHPFPLSSTIHASENSVEANVNLVGAQ